MEFRALLIDLFNQLSDSNRQALHFFVGNKVPRKERDNATPEGSLRLLDSLFDRNLINEQNFEYLINAFEQIHCMEVAEQLKEHKLNSIHSSISESILMEYSSSVEADKMRSLSNCLQKQSSHLSSIPEDSSREFECPMVQSSTITSFDGIFTFDKVERKTPLTIIQKILHSKLNRLALVSFTIIILYIICCLVLLRLLSIPTSEHPTCSLDLIHITREGRQYGHTNVTKNITFDDAKDLELSYTDRCIGVQLQWTDISLMSVQFLYSKNRSSSQLIRENKDPSILPLLLSSTFILTINEEITKINLYLTNTNIIGIQFCTTSGRKSEVFGSTDGEFWTESFEDHTFGYAKGRETSYMGVEMLQFTWIKQISVKEKIATVPREMREICEFTFTSKNDLHVVHAKGIESSWHDLKKEYHREGVECDPSASYYQKIRPEDRGPQLFAIVNHSSVSYHDKGRWQQYISVKNINCNIIPWSDSKLIT